MTRTLKKCWVNNETSGNAIILKCGGIRDAGENECGMTNFDGGMRDDNNLVGAGFVQFD